MSLTTEDKEWIAGTIQTAMDGLEAHIMGRVAGRIDASEDRMKLHVTRVAEATETKLLTEFHKWGRISDTRTRQALENVAAFNERLMAPEDRVSSLERKPS
jgi:hypothetical protein